VHTTNLQLLSMHMHSVQNLTAESDGVPTHSAAYLLYSLLCDVPVRVHEVVSHSVLSSFLSQAQGFESTLKNEFGESHRLRTVSPCTVLATCTCVHSSYYCSYMCS
jgi:hypothetical protein